MPEEARARRVATTKFLAIKYCSTYIFIMKKDTPKIFLIPLNMPLNQPVLTEAG